MRLNSDLLNLHLAVLLLGMTGLFGKFLSLNPAAIISGRSFFTVVFLILVLMLTRQSISFGSYKNLSLLVLSGLVLTLHWFTFFHSIQLSTVAIGVIGFSTYPVFVTFLEPVVFKERYKIIDIGSGLLVFIGLIFVVPNFDLSNQHTIALVWAVLAGLLAALLTLINRKLVADNHFFVITTYQHAAAFVLTLPIIWIFDFWPSIGEIGMLMILGVIFTAIPQTMLVRALKVVKAQMASVMVGLEPVYSIIFAIILISEMPSFSTLIGGLIVLSAVVLAAKSHSTLKGSQGKFLESGKTRNRTAQN